jgi:Zn-dependent peptidase ImmA (M78 family)
VAKSPPAFTTPAVLRWARETMGLTVQDAAKKMDVAPDKLEAAEAGDAQLTMRQAEKAAKAYDRSTADLFLPEPPQEEPLEAKFRRLPDAPPLPWPPEMYALARRIRERQDAALEIYELLEEEPRWQSVGIDYSDDAAVLGARARARLGVALSAQRSWRDSSGYQPLREWVDAVESLGVLVMQDGTVPVDAMRGFASTHAQVPAIVVNTDDDARARAFTVVHELGHLLRADAGRTSRSSDEPWCDDFAGEVMVPATSLRVDFAREAGGRDLLAVVDSLALTYGVTPNAMAVRLSRQRLISAQESAEVIERIQERWRGMTPSAGGGNYYRTTVARLGPSFIRLVFTALDSQAVSFPVAAGVLGVKVNNFPKLRETMMSRSGTG